MPDWTEEDIEAAMYLYDDDDDSVTAPLQIMPFMPRAGEKPDARGPPTITELHALLLQSRDRLFFIANCIPCTSVRKWQLVQVAYTDSIAMHPDCLTDGRFLVDFFILHPDDCRYNAVNQRYWMEYHTESTLY